MELTPQDNELFEAAKRTADDLHLDGIHEVAAALRTASGKLFTGIHIEADVGLPIFAGRSRPSAAWSAQVIEIWKRLWQWRVMAKTGICYLHPAADAER